LEQILVRTQGIYTACPSSAYHVWYMHDVNLYISNDETEVQRNENNFPKSTQQVEELGQEPRSIS
jgi:hypothetical protein